MSVSAVNTISASGGFRAGHREYTVVFEVLTDSVNDGPKTIWADASTPGPGDSYAYGSESDAFALVARDRTCQLLDADGTRKQWRLTVRYTTDGENQSSTTEEDAADNPLNEPVEWSGSWLNYQRFISEDKQGRTMNASSGEAFDPTPIDDPRPTIRATKNFASFNPSWVTDMNQDGAVVNSDNFLGFGPRRVKVQSIEWQQVFYGGSSGTGDYYRVTFSFEVNNTAQGWDIDYLDESFEFIDAATNKATRIKLPHPGGTAANTGSDPCPTKQPLDGFGGVLPQGLRDLNAFFYRPGGGVYYELYNAIPFSSFGLPATIGD